jgi:hypothetical protein
MSKINIIGGGTFNYISNHFAVSAPAFGETAKRLQVMLPSATLHLTRMADRNSRIETNQDLEALIDSLIADPETRAIIMNAAVADWSPVSLVQDGKEVSSTWSKYSERLKTSEGNINLELTPSDKILSKIRKERKDIYLVATKATTGASEREQYISALNLLKANSANLVLANDTVTKRNIVVTPEESWYGDGTRENALEWLVKITSSRMKNTFTRSTIVDGSLISWDDTRVPNNLREVVNHLILSGSYKPFRGKTAGHFAVKIAEDMFLTSARKTNFNIDLYEKGLIKVVSSGPDSVIAQGARPSVGGQSQRIIFKNHPGFDCIAHAHVPIKVPGSVSTIEQWPRECGSHECGAATSAGLRDVGPGIKSVYLDGHGPNVVFRSDVDPANVIRYFNDHFLLSEKTGGPVA